MEVASPAFQDGFLTTEPLGKKSQEQTDHLPFPPLPVSVHVRAPIQDLYLAATVKAPRGPKWLLDPHLALIRDWVSHGG